MLYFSMIGKVKSYNNSDMKKIILCGLFVAFFINSFGQDYFTDTRDGNSYKTIIIGKNFWMAENLKYDNAEGSSYFDNNPDNKSSYGNLYNWNTATKVCPKGWHLPSGEEFKEMIDYYDGKGGLEKIVKDTNTINFQLGGMKDFEGTDSEIDESGYYWSSTEYDKDYAQYFGYMIILNNPVIDLSRKEDNEDVHGSEKSSAYSVRCIKPVEKSTNN
jgi:uncharacterized protein (TIGR02145 family)